MSPFVDMMQHLTFYTALASLPSLRQLLSGFDDSSMYFLTRTTLQECKADTLMPATVFTACDLPHNKGFGFSNIFANQNSLPVPPTLRNLSNNERIQDSREQFQFFLVNFQGCTEKSDYHE